MTEVKSAQQRSRVVLTRARETSPFVRAGIEAVRLPHPSVFAEVWPAVAVLERMLGVDAPPQEGLEFLS